MDKFLTGLKLKKIIDAYSVREQEDVAIEEMSELTKAILKVRRKGLNRESLDSLIDEIADVNIMLEQLMIIYGCKNEVEKQMQFKIDRQLQRIEVERLQREMCKFVEMKKEKKHGKFRFKIR